MAKLSKGKKIVIGIVVAVLVATVICATVPQVRSSITDLIMKLDLNGDKQRKEKAHEDEHYKNLPEEEKEKFDQKINQIIESNEYKGLTEDEKDALIDKFLESEKIQQEIKIEQEEQEIKKEEIKENLKDVSDSLKDVIESGDASIIDVQDELNNVKNELQEIINSDSSSPEEIAAAEKKLQQVENVEREYVYQEASSTIRDAAAQNQGFKNDYPGTSIKKIYEIYSDGGSIFVNADIIQTETIADIDIVSIKNCICEINSRILSVDLPYSELIDYIANGSELFKIKSVCTNRNAETHKEFFEQNKYSIDPSIKTGESNGYRFSVVESWENNQDSAHPEYLINCERDGEEDLFLITYSYGRYVIQGIKKICPEFWSQMEVEQNKQAEAQQVA